MFFLKLPLLYTYVQTPLSTFNQLVKRPPLFYFPAYIHTYIHPLTTKLLRTSPVDGRTNPTAPVAAELPLGAHVAAALLVHGHRRETELLGAPLARLDAGPAARVAALEPGLADGRAALHDGDGVREEGAGGFRGGGGVQREGVGGRADLLRAHHARLDADAAGGVAAGQAGLADRGAALDPDRRADLQRAHHARLDADAAGGVAAGQAGRADRGAALDPDRRADLLRAHHARLDADAARGVAAGQAGRADRGAALAPAGDGGGDGDALGLAGDDGAGGRAGALDCRAGGDGGGGGGVEVDGGAVDHPDAAGQDGQQESPGGFGEAGHGEGVRMKGCCKARCRENAKSVWRVWHVIKLNT